MGIWGKKPRPTPPTTAPLTQSAPAASGLTASEQVKTTGSPRALWADSLGRLAIRCAQVLLVLLVTGVVVYAGVQLKVIVIPVLLALIIASAIAPFIGWLVRHRWPRMLATWTALLAGIVVIGGIVTLVVFGIRSEWEMLVEAVTRGIDTVQDFIASGALPISDEQLTDLRDTVVDFLTSAEFGLGAVAGVGTAVEVIAGLVLMVVLLFFFLKDGPAIWAFLISPLRPEVRDRAKRVGGRAVEVLGGYLSGTAIIALVDGVVIGGALFIMQVPLALPLAILVFLGGFIPIVGATVTGIAAALVALVTNDLVTALIIGGVVIAINQLEGDLLAPFVLGKSLQLHALVVLLALSAGTILGGIIGTFLGVPIAAVAWAVIKAWKTPPQEWGPLREKPSLLRKRKRGPAAV